MSTVDTSDSLDTDVVVLGGGIAGMTAAAFAATQGLRVILIEKAPEIGGTTTLSGGRYWYPTDPEVWAERDPGANQPVLRALTAGYESANSWIESLGAEFDPPEPFDHLTGIPSVVRKLDILTYINRCKSRITTSNGWIITNAQVTGLITEDSAVVGVVAEDQDGPSEIRCQSVILATGGIQADSTMRTSYIGSFATELALRSNRFSVGDGLRLGLSVGAKVHRSLRFYGHLMAVIGEEYEPKDYVRFAQTYSPRTLLLDRSGNRFIDESIAYYQNAYAVSRLSPQRALLVGDEVIREYDRTSRGKVDQIDHPAEAAAHGGRVAIADTWAEIADQVSAWGYMNFESAVSNFNESVRTGHFEGPSRTQHRRQLEEPPYFAMEVRPAITFAFTGLEVNGNAQVMSEEGRPILGLLAAGVDVGAYDTTYGGGLSLGVVTGLIAATTAAGQSEPDKD